jgi:hypothetical protein
MASITWEAIFGDFKRIKQQIESHAKHELLTAFSRMIDATSLCEKDLVYISKCLEKLTAQVDAPIVADEGNENWTTIPTKKKKRKPTAYHKFLSEKMKEIRRLKKIEDPGYKMSGPEVSWLHAPCETNTEVVLHSTKFFECFCNCCASEALKWNSELYVFQFLDRIRITKSTHMKIAVSGPDSVCVPFKCMAKVLKLWSLEKAATQIRASESHCEGETSSAGSKLSSQGARNKISKERVSDTSSQVSLFPTGGSMSSMRAS